MKNRFSIKMRMIIIFGLLIIAAFLLLSALVLNQSRTAVMEKVTAHLFDKVSDAAVIIDGEIKLWFEYLDGIASQQILYDDTVSYTEKARFLKELSRAEKKVIAFGIIDPKGIYYLPDGKQFDVSGQKWFRESQGGTKRYFSEPFNDIETGRLILQAVVPIIGENNTLKAVLAAILDGYTLSEMIDPIKIGETGSCFILSESGVNIANRNRELVEKYFNVIESVKTDKSLAAVAAVIEDILKSHKTEIGYYTFMGSQMIASGAVMKTTGWNIVIEAPVKEFLGTIDTMRTGIIITALLILMVSLVIVYIVAHRIV